MYRFDSYVEPMHAGAYRTPALYEISLSVPSGSSSIPIPFIIIPVRDAV